mmetsp:Transcript_19648/g.59561  ORF Transcript_19648/g.59561 Transcript_19648/m.59561 type:complete len:329 (-) Transcript_19648:415-1401(-)|eukprot:scaffold153827_cov33-Tisochrysis_lutea.AAC.1
MRPVNLKVQTNLGNNAVAPRKVGEPSDPVTPVGRASFADEFSFHSGHGTQLTPQPVVIEMPSPGSFDPVFEQFLRPPLTLDACNCLLERSKSGKDFLMMLEEGNVPLIRATKKGRNFTLSAADGTIFATLDYEAGRRGDSGCYLLHGTSTSIGMAGNAPCVAGFILGEAELGVAGNPTVNTMILGAGLPDSDWSPNLHGAPLASILGRSDAQMTSMLMAHQADWQPDCSDEQRAIPPIPPSMLVLRSRCPSWNAERDLLTLDFPKGRALLASHQNFQLESNDDSGKGLALVRGLMESKGGVDRFSLDFAAPLSPAVALAACLCSEEWQ